MGRISQKEGGENPHCPHPCLLACLPGTHSTCGPSDLTLHPALCTSHEDLGELSCWCTSRWLFPLCCLFHSSFRKLAINRGSVRILKGPRSLVMKKYYGNLECAKGGISDPWGKDGLFCSQHSHSDKNKTRLLMLKWTPEKKRFKYWKL